MKSLELFCGTKSFTKNISSRCEEVITLDFCKDFNPTICCDILDWDYTQFKPYYFDIIWASPNCKEWSTANTIRREFRLDRIERSRSVVKKVLEIIDYFKPKYWVIENPQTGRLKNEEFMKSLPYVDADYCRYGFSYRKRTRFWTNIKWKSRPLCNKKNGYCKSKLQNIEKTKRIAHPHGFGSGYSTYSDGETKGYKNKIMIPNSLINEIIDCL